MPIAAHFEKYSHDGATGYARGRAERRRILLTTHGSLKSGVETALVLHNLSETGVLLESPVNLEIGEQLDLSLPGAAEVPSRVVWASGHLYGCAFDSILSQAVVSAVALQSVGQHELEKLPAPVPISPSAVGGGTLGERIQRLRKLRGLTQGELANRLGVSKPTVWAWEQGRARPIDNRLDAIAIELGVTLQDLQPDALEIGVNSLITRCREQIAAALETTTDKVRIMIEL